MNIRKVPESAGNSYFKDLNVCYWQGATYNNTNENKQAMIDIDLGLPLLDEASNYVCAVERLELSGNNIAYYDSEQDTFLYPGDAGNNTVMILGLALNRNIPEVEISVLGKFFSLPDLIQELNKKLVEANNNTFRFSLEMSGAISCNIIGNRATYFPNLALAFKGTNLAKIFGLPEDPILEYNNANGWYNHYRNLSSTDYRFITRASRLDCGYIPSLILLRSNLPLESDQTDNSKVNIVTDFSITAGSDVAASYNLATVQVNGTRVAYNPGSGYSWSINGGGTIVYIPNERRWLNFSAPIPIYNIRLWIDIVYNDSSTKTYYLPPGGVFRVKFGFYQRE